MNNRVKIILIIFSFISTTYFTQGQTTDLHKYADIKYSLNGDTLFTNNDFKIYIGQKLLVGKGSDENGWYNSISFKNPANYAVLLWRKMELENNVDYQLDEEKRNKDKVKEYLHEGDSLVVTKIKKRGNKRFGYSYVVFLRQGTGILSIDYSCFIYDAIKNGEILIVIK